MTLTDRAKALTKKLSLISTAFVLAVSTLTALTPFVLSQEASAAPATGTQVVTGDTAAGYNQPGWLFNRDTTYATPTTFVNSNPSTGSGSLYVKPISSTNPASKFIAENFIFTEIEAIDSISVDYKLGSPTSQARQVYMNVYANYATSPADKYFDCRYDVVSGGIGSSSAYSTLTFSPSATYTTTAGCPSSPSEMGEGATVRAYSVSYGGTSLSDAGMSAYFDNARISTTSGITTYDFEAAPTAIPTGLTLYKGTTAVASGSAVKTTDAELRWTPVSGAANYQVRVTNPSDTSQTFRTGWYTLDLSNPNHFGTQQGDWKYEVRAQDAESLAWSAWSNTVSLVYDTVKPVLSLPEGSIVGNAPYTFTISQTEANPEKTVVEIQQMVNGKWKKLNDKWFYGDNTFNYTVNPAAIGLQDGVITQIKVNSWDAAGNTVSSTSAVVVDLTAPTGEIRYGNTAPINGNVIAYLTTDTVVATPDGWTATDTSGKKFSKKFTTNANTTVTFYDLADNPGTAQVAITWIDKTAPVAQIASPVSENISGVVTITGAIDDAHPMNSFFEINGPNGYKVSSKNTNGVTEHSFAWDTTLLENGQYTISFETRDRANNKGASSTTTKVVTVDNTAPTLTIESPASSTEQPTSFAVSGVAGDSDSGVALVSYNVSNLSGSYGSTSLNDSVASGTIPLGANGSWNFALNEFSSGFYRVTVTVQDEAGNTFSESIDVSVDATGPELAFTVGNSGRTIVGSTTDPDQPVTVTIDGYNPVTFTPGSGNWVYTIPAAIPNGTYDVTVSSMDIYGNTTEVNDEATFTVFVPEEEGTTIDEEDSDASAAGANGNESSQLNGGFPLAAILGTNTTIPPADAADESAQTDGAAEVEGTSTENNLAQAVDTDSTDGSVFGLAWYWWLLIVAALATLIWWITAAIRNRSEA